MKRIIAHFALGSEPHNMTEAIRETRSCSTSLVVAEMRWYDMMVAEKKKYYRRELGSGNHAISRAVYFIISPLSSDDRPLLSQERFVTPFTKALCETLLAG
jgi:hypothetical protein